MTVEHLDVMRRSTILFRLTRHLLDKFRDPGGEPKVYLFGQLKRITREWLEGGYLRCIGTKEAQVLYPEIADMACNRISRAITASMVGDWPVKAVLNPYNPTGTTRHVNFTISKLTRWKTDPRRSQVNWAICDRDWEPSSAVSRRLIRACAPTSRTRVSVSRSHTCWDRRRSGTCPISSSRSMTGTTIC